MTAPDVARHSWSSREFWTGKRVFLTGHTGFKGGWLTLWLLELGALVKGFSLAPPTYPNLFTLARVDEGIDHEIGDVTNLELLQKSVQAFQPDIIFHLAAQPLVRASYEDPVGTFTTNVLGTVNVLEAARQSHATRAVLIVTTDKCYENHEQIWPYREIDRMGGKDPYSSSKGCAELVTSAYGRSFFQEGRARIASLRAGNVIGGGDWAKDRLIVDVLAAFELGEQPFIRNPQAVRPWQHVLEPLQGYLRAAEYLWTRGKGQPDAWNFGPDSANELTVAEVVNLMSSAWGKDIGSVFRADTSGFHEAGWLRLDATKARHELGWRPLLSLREALKLTVDWHKIYQSQGDMRATTFDQIRWYGSMANRV